jgi:hypothetical protein
MTGLAVGTWVRLNEAFKALPQMREHVAEFGLCRGQVIGPTFTDPVVDQAPEVDVRWQPSGLRYAYAPEHLEVIR